MESVLKSMESFSLTVEEDAIVEVATDQIKENLKNFPHSAVGKILAPKIINSKAFQSTIRRAWGVGEDVRINIIGPNVYQFLFPNDFTMERVLEEGPWSFDNHMLVLKRWEIGMAATNLSFDSISLWTQAWGLPLVCHTHSVASLIGNTIGSFISPDNRQEANLLNSHLRFRASFPLSKPIRRGCRVKTPNGECVWVNLKYERLSDFCYYCGYVGHDERRCERKFDDVKAGTTSSGQYGPWLVADRTWNRKARSTSDSQGGKGTGDKDDSVNSTTQATPSKTNSKVVENSQPPQKGTFTPQKSTPDQSQAPSQDLDHHGPEEQMLLDQNPDANTSSSRASTKRIRLKAKARIPKNTQTNSLQWGVAGGKRKADVHSFEDLQVETMGIGEASDGNKRMRTLDSGVIHCSNIISAVAEEAQSRREP
ncbi:uncharacterized protein LOC120008131 [Tripterygium wilfordii]|uniref:uncharacterized protein LOC120008131 n=1 Tax=Tripterygium wilfordii TaxID=458696 RepID=UPI0018F82E5A|nr:uncharacterized protein LOC120008131 [Tripterygium wilfordii]